MRNGDLWARNRLFYDALWGAARLVPPQRFATWPLVRSLLADGGERLEVAPGLRPRLPLDGTFFLDASLAALARLRDAGARVTCASLASLPYADGAFGLVAALDVIEHVEDDAAAFAELSRVLRPGGTLLLSVPLHPAAWTVFDDIVGHGRRYTPERLGAMLDGHGLHVERHGGYGMQPRSGWLTRLGMWCFARHTQHAMQWYNRLFFPIALRRQRPLDLREGAMPLQTASEIFLVCRKAGGAGPPG